MDTNRRTFLKGVALTGLAVATPGFPSGNILSNRINSLKGDAKLPLIALIQDSPDESAFLTGIRCAQQQQRSNDPITVQRCERELGFLQSLHALLHSGERTQIVGLVDDASAAIIVDLARSAGVRMPWLGQHAVSAVHARHNILTANAEHGWSLRFAQELNTRHAGSYLAEEPVAGHDGLHRMTIATRQAPPNGSWATSLGFAMASRETASSAQAPWGGNSAAAAPLLGNFVSFSFNT